MADVLVVEDALHQARDVVHVAASAFAAVAFDFVHLDVQPCGGSEDHVADAVGRH